MKAIYVFFRYLETADPAAVAVAAATSAIAPTVPAVPNDKSTGTKAQAAVDSKAAGANRGAAASHVQPAGRNIEPPRLDRRFP